MCSVVEEFRFVSNSMACDDDGLSTYGLAVLGAGAAPFRQNSTPRRLCFRSRCHVRCAREGQLLNE